MLVREFKQDILWKMEWNTEKVLSRKRNTMYEAQMEHDLTWTRHTNRLRPIN